MTSNSFSAVYISVITVAICSSLFLGASARESLIIVDCQFYDAIGFIGVEVKNAGTANIRLVEIIVNSVPLYHQPDGLITIDAGTTDSIGIPYNWSSGSPYTISLITAKGNVFSTSTIAP